MSNLVPCLRYAWLTLKHKWFVFRAGLKTGAPLWLLLIHDLSKFTPAELPHYARAFFGSKDDPEGFARAWNHHQKSNRHHWEYWIPATAHDRNSGRQSPGRPLAMPDKYVREMVADWLGASRAYDGKWPESFEGWAWFQKDFYSRINLHPHTRHRAIEILEGAGVKGSAFSGVLSLTD